MLRQSALQPAIVAQVQGPSIGSVPAPDAGAGSTGVQQAMQPLPTAGPVVVQLSNSLWWELWREAIAHFPTVNQVIKVACMMSNMVVQLSPLPQVSKWVSRGCTGEADGAPVVSIMYGGWQWLAYGLCAYLVTKRSGFLTLVYANTLGAVLGTYYTFIFYRNCQNSNRMSLLRCYFYAMFAFVSVQVCAALAMEAQRALFFSGLIASCCSVIGACSTLVTMPVVISTRDSASIPGNLVCAGLASAMLWTACGHLLEDMWILVPSAFSVCTNSFALSLKVAYHSKVQEDALEKLSTEEDLKASPKAPAPAKSKRFDQALGPEAEAAARKIRGWLSRRRREVDVTGGTTGGTF